MTYHQLVHAHLATILPAFVIGTLMLFMRKGTGLHRALGRLYMPLMLATASITLFMPAHVGPRLLQHFGFIHLFSILVFYSVPAAYLHARRGDIPRHRREMVGLYVGGLLIAGSFALMPGRMMNGVLLQP